MVFSTVEQPPTASASKAALRLSCHTRSGNKAVSFDATLSVDAAGLIAAAAWPDRPGAILIVGHQPTLGRVAATLLSGAQADWHMAKGAVWWLRHVEGETKLFAVVHPKLA